MMTEQQVMKELKISNWKIITPQKMAQLIEMSHKIDKEVFISILNQIPNSIELMKVSYDGLEKTVNASCKSNSETQENLSKLMEELSRNLHNDNLNEKQIDKIVESLCSMGDRIERTDEKQKSFLTDKFDKFMGIIVGFTSSAIFGIILAGLLNNDNSKNKKI